MLLQTMKFETPTAALFFNHSPTKLIVACLKNIFIVDVNTKHRRPLDGTPPYVLYQPHALALIADDSVLVAGKGNYRYHGRGKRGLESYTVRGFDMVSGTLSWTHNPLNCVGAVCMLGSYVLVAVHCKPTLVLDCYTGTEVSVLHKTGDCISGMGAIEGLCFVILSFIFHLLRPPHLHLPCNAAAPPL